jgi:rubrerythrin
MMLRTFGALVTGALQLEESLATYYERAAQCAGEGAAKTLLNGLGEETRALSRRLERVRREQVNEMLLEPIPGLDPADYVLPLETAGDTSEEAILTRALEAEETIARYYRDAAEQMPVPEARRSLSRTADVHTRQAARLREATGGHTA